MDDGKAFFAGRPIERSGSLVLGDHAHKERPEFCRYRIDEQLVEAIQALLRCAAPGTDAILKPRPSPFFKIGDGRVNPARASPRGAASSERSSKADALC